MFDLVVVGGGAGGIHVARKAAEVGARVALIEKARLGGQHASTAGVPGKALLRAARAAAEIRGAAAFGVRAARSMSISRRSWPASIVWWPSRPSAPARR